MEQTNKATRVDERSRTITTRLNGFKDATIDAHNARNKIKNNRKNSRLLVKTTPLVEIKVQEIFRRRSRFLTDRRISCCVNGLPESTSCCAKRALRRMHTMRPPFAASG